jgi:polar amino acid transport system substrate-binding protein
VNHNLKENIMRRSPALRRIIPAIAVGALVLAACGSDDDGGDSAGDTSAPTGTDAPADTAGEASGAVDCGATIEEGVLTIATGEPAFYPWVIDDAPETGEGFEAAVALAVAAEMGYEGDAVVWTRTTFDEAIQPGAKSFDMNLQQYSITEERRENIDFSLPYYTSNQAIVALDGSAAEGATSIADLKDVKFGAQVGTTSLDFITEVIQPNQDPFVYDDNVGAKAALEANQIDAAVFDLPTALYVSGVEIEGSSVIGQFPADAGGTTDQFGFVLEKGSALTSCVDAAITTLTENGELEAITQEWLSDFTGAPVITVE